MLDRALIDERALHHVGRILTGVRPLVIEELRCRLAGHGLVRLGAAGMGRAAAAHANVPRHGGQRRHRAERLVRVVGALHTLTHADARRLRLAVFTGERLDHVGRHAGQLAGALQGVLGGTLLQMHESRLHRHAVGLEGALDRCFHTFGVRRHGLVLGRIPHHVAVAFAAQVLSIIVAHEKAAAAVLGEEFLIVAIVGDDPIHHAKGQRRVAAGTDGDPLIGDGGRR